MKLFTFASRPVQNATQIPHIRVETAHLIGPGKLRKNTEHLVFESAETRQIRLDIEGLRDVLTYGNVTATGEAVALLREHKISLAMLNSSGTRLWGQLSLDSSDRVLTKLLQLQVVNDDHWRLTCARDIVVEKLESTATALRHYQRQSKKLTSDVLHRIERAIQSAGTMETVDQLRGIEGQTAALWYAQLGRFLAPRWKFISRSRRPPRDAVNALLSLGYMQLYRRCAARLEASGYEASLGALHEFRPGRLSLACDMMEPLRIPAVDRWVYAICQQGIVHPEDFVESNEFGVRLKKEKLPAILGRFEESWHQGMFRQILDDRVVKLRQSFKDSVSNQTNQMASQLTKQLLETAEGSGEYIP